MMAKFCHLEASPQNNEVCGLDWMGSWWLRVEVKDMTPEVMIWEWNSCCESVSCLSFGGLWNHSHSSSYVMTIIIWVMKNIETFHHGQKRKGLTKFDRFWRSSLSSKQPNLGAQCCGSCKGGTVGGLDWWVPKSELLNHRSWCCITKIPFQRLVSDFRLS